MTENYVASGSIYRYLKCLGVEVFLGFHILEYLHIDSEISQDGTQV